MRDLAIAYDQIETEGLLQDWTWLVPPDDTPLMIGAFGDWIFGAPDASHWNLSLLDGSYRMVARNSEEFNRLKKDFDNLEDWFQAGWVQIAAAHGLVPGKEECLGWKVSPLIGGRFEVANIQVFSLSMYQLLMGQLHRFAQLGPDD